MSIVATIAAPIVVALIAAPASILVSLYTQFQTRITATRLSELEAERDEARARRDYEYEARKRLYERCEPLIFQANELAGIARKRVCSLARTARHGDLLPDGSGWLSAPGYYFDSTVYMLLAPATVFRLLQRRLTMVDLSLEPRIHAQYEVLKLIFLSFTADFDVAGSEPTLVYEPNKAYTGPPEGHEQTLADLPQQYAHQGLYRGVVDIVVDALIVEDVVGEKRVMGFGEFLREWERPESALHRTREPLLELLIGFHPARKPVLWRVLLAQHMLYTALLRDNPFAVPLAPPSADDLKAFDWRCAPASEATDTEVSAAALVAHAYVSAKLVTAGERVKQPTAV